MTGNVAAVVVAGGRGLRAGGDLPKQYRVLGNVPVLRQSLTIFATHAEVDWVQPVIHRDDGPFFTAATEGLAILPPAHGGATRQASVRAGLEALADHRPAIVLVHDAARPFTSPALVSRAIAAAGQGSAMGAAIPGVAMTDTIKEVDADGAVVRTLDRARLRGIQTPQAFAFDALLAAHRKAAAAGREDFTDDAALADGDIGAHFPPSDPQWKGASSDRFLKFAVERVAKRGGRIAHLDLTVVCEAPKIGPHRDAMRARIAEIAGITIDRVGVKATTSEKLGFTGRREGLVAMATATVRLPWSAA
jgi:2-C-methyl-D-erythritol 4-phosphate cytidylyltransferase